MTLATATDIYFSAGYPSMPGADLERVTLYIDTVTTTMWIWWTPALVKRQHPLFAVLAVPLVPVLCFFDDALGEIMQLSILVD